MKNLLSLASGLILVTLLLCSPYLTRKCDHCHEPTLYIPVQDNVAVKAKESFLDRILNDYAYEGVYHTECLNEVYGEVY
jgi:hypothetical protein